MLYLFWSQRKKKNKRKISNSHNVTRTIGKLLITKLETHICIHSSTSCYLFQYKLFFFHFLCHTYFASSLALLPVSPLTPTTRNSSSAQFQSKVVNKKIVTRKVSNKVSTSDRFPLYTQFIQGLGERGWGQLCGRHCCKLSCLLRQRDKLSSNSISISPLLYPLRQ